ncbi:aminopeptidase family [Shewanella violacea DSS12]|uniref:Aminopeptidase family n=1 Tax=Shewanella violacea (strain JCM 10179 / CIP 106290 / LMG 19151 / DSS12) TaxID=637905 RepID=D4ZFC9_SHEVD|nr:aminopeptidase family [Shewanella violacea DSS12]
MQYDPKLLADEQALPHPKDNIQWGSYRQHRENNDLLSYDLTLKVDIDKRYLTGHNKIRFRMLQRDDTIRIDLYKNLQIDKISYKDQILEYERDLNAVYIHFPAALELGSVNEIDFHYSGQPSTKGRFGCFTFKKDSRGLDWVNTACQGTGSMVWWPNKDQQRDEVESMTMRISVPSHLKNISNGRLIATNILADGYTEYVWQTNNPINNYSVSLNIGNYVHFGENLGELSLDYYVLEQDLAKAKQQFTQVIPMMKSYQKHFGQYPFIQDGYKLIQAPYTGMEHQSAITYGNQFKNGYNRGDGSDPDWTGVGISLKFDFIIIHESGHEWFGNSLTSNDFSDAWIHEAWCTYAESVYVEDQFGYPEAIKYINGYKDKVKNRYPMIGPPSIGHWPTSDIYFKGTLFINTLRHIINDDKKWWDGIRAFTSKFNRQNLDTLDVLNFFNNYFDRDFEKVFDQYLYFNQLPTLELYRSQDSIEYRWQADVSDFTMPVPITLDGKKRKLLVTDSWQSLPLESEFKVNTDLVYINISRLTNRVKKTAI